MSLLCSLKPSIIIKKMQASIAPKINYSGSSHFTVKEIKIPIAATNGHLAGKLWQNPNAKNKEPTTPILCMHGIQDNAGSFDALLPLLLKDDENRSFFALDMPGHGLSTHTTGPYYHMFIEGLTSIKRVKQYFGWERFTLLGHSLGAVISFIYSATYPQEIDRYIAMDNLRPVPCSELTTSFDNVVQTLFSVEEKLFSNDSRPKYKYEDLLERMYSSRKGTVTKEGCRKLLERGAEMVGISNSQELYQFTHDIKTAIPLAFRFLSGPQAEEMGKKITCPILFVKGEPGEDYEPRENLMRFLDYLKEEGKQLEFHTVKGTHHFHLNEPENVAGIIDQFLRKSF